MSYIIQYHKDLTPEEYQYCIDNIDKENCKIKLFCSHIKLAVKIANKFKHKVSTTYEYDDVESTAIYALWHAIELFDPSKGNKLTTYVYPAIKHAILCELRSRENDVEIISINVKDDDNDKELNILDIIEVHNDELYTGNSRLEDIVLNGEAFPYNIKDRYIARRILIDGAKQIDVAKELNLSRQCVSVRYLRLKNKIRKYISENNIDIRGD